MSNENPQVAPPLSINLSKHVPSYPLLQNGTFHFKVHKVEVKDTASGEGKYASVELKTVQAATSRTGEPLQPGVSVFETFNLVPSGKMKAKENGGWNIIADTVAPFIQSIEGGVPNADLATMATWFPSLQGRLLKATIGYVPAGTDKRTGKTFKEKNEVTTWHRA